MASRLAQLAIAARGVHPTPFRSGGAPQLSDALDAIVARSFGIPPKSSNEILDERAAQLSTTEEAAVDSALAAVNAIRSGQAAKEFPISSALLHPQHDPEYYNRMREGVHRSAKGIQRSWWKRFFQVRGKA